MTTHEDKEPAEEEEHAEAARFVPPQRRRRPLLVVGAITVAVVVSLIFLMARGPDVEATAEDIVETTLAGLPDGALAGPDLRAAADGLQRALGLHSASEPALEATGLLHRRVAQQVEMDTVDGTLERAAEVLEEASAQWPGEQAFADNGPLRKALDGALERRTMSREADELLAAAEERLAGDPSEADAIREALDMLRRALDIDPGNPRARSVRDDLRRDVLAAAQGALQAGETDEAGRLLDTMNTDSQDDSELTRLRDTVERQLAERAQGLEIRRLLELAERRLAADRLTSPARDNAVVHYRAALRLDPDNEAARGGLERIAERYGVLIRDAIDDGALTRADRLLGSLADLAPDHPMLEPLRGQVAAAGQADNAGEATAEAARPETPAAGQGRVSETPREDIPTDPEGRLWFDVRTSCVDAELRRYIEAYPAGRYIEEAWRRISSCIEAR